MEFFNLKYLYLIPLVIIIFLMIKKGEDRKKEILTKLKLKKPITYTKYLTALGILLMAVSLIGPRVLRETEKVEVLGTDIYVLIDVSKSMMAEDLVPNRITKAKEEIKNIIDGLKGDRVGFIPFTSDAYIQMPLTDDYDMAKMYLDVIDTDLLYSTGTNFNKAIKLATDSFHKSGQGKGIILIVSDGEDHSEGIKGLDKDIDIYSIGVGTEKGSVIPGENGFIKDKKGSIVVSKLESKALKDISKRGGYFESNNFVSASDKFLRSIELLKRDSQREEEVKVYKELYQILLGLGILLVMGAYYLEERYR